VQAGVVDREAGAAAHLFGERQVVGGEAPPGRGRDERERAERAAARGERGDDGRREPDLAQQGEVRGTPRARREHVVRDLGVELRPPGPHHGRHARRRVGRRGVVAPDLPRPRHPRGVGVRHGGLLERAVGVDEVHRAPVGERRHGEGGDLRERRRRVERAVEEARRLRQEGRPPARPLGVARALGERLGRRVQRLRLRLELGRLLVQLLVRPLELELLVLEPCVAHLERPHGLQQGGLRRVAGRHVLVGEDDAGHGPRRVADGVGMPLGPEHPPAAGGARDVVADGRQCDRLARPARVARAVAAERAREERQQAGRGELRVRQHGVVRGRSARPAPHSRSKAGLTATTRPAGS
jgi:hypothetical protein